MCNTLCCREIFSRCDNAAFSVLTTETYARLFLSRNVMAIILEFFNDQDANFPQSPRNPSRLLIRDPFPYKHWPITLVQTWMVYSSFTEFVKPNRCWIIWLSSTLSGNSSPFMKTSAGKNGPSRGWSDGPHCVVRFWFSRKFFKNSPFTKVALFRVHSLQYFVICSLLQFRGTVPR
jgi:hypothetical protein